MKRLLFRAQHGDIGPVEVEEEDITYELLQERVYESWPKSSGRENGVERGGEQQGDDPGTRDAPPSVSTRGSGPCGVDTKDDIKFIWNGRVLGTTAELQQVYVEYFGKMDDSKRDAGKGGTCAEKKGSTEAGMVLILHAVVRPPSAPMKRKGKKGVDAGGPQPVGGREGDDMACQCCAVQ